MKTLQLPLPKEIQKIVNTLNNHYEVVYVGGCVRDYLLNKEIHDYDCATQASVDQMKEVLHEFKIIETGIKHGTLTILHHSHQVEITTYRKDLDYENHRTPKQLCFVQSLEEDLKRRDFTINAMAITPNGTFIDHHHGYEDLNNKIIRCIGDPHKRFEEDALRILRALRFAYTLDFTIEDETAKAIQQKKHLLENISIERKTNEFFQMLSINKKNLLHFLDDYGILEYYDLNSQMDESLNQCINDIECKLSCLFKTQEEAKQTLTKWHCSKKTIQHVLSLMKEKERNEDEDIHIRRILFEYQDPSFIQKLFQFLNMDPKKIHEIITSHQYFQTLSINGHDIKQYYSKHEIKEVYNKCIELCLQDPTKNDRDFLLTYIQSLKKD